MVHYSHPSSILLVLPEERDLSQSLRPSGSFCSAWKCSAGPLRPSCVSWKYLHPSPYAYADCCLMKRPSLNPRNFDQTSVRLLWWWHIFSRLFQDCRDKTIIICLWQKYGQKYCMLHQEVETSTRPYLYFYSASPQSHYRSPTSQLTEHIKYFMVLQTPRPVQFTYSCTIFAYLLSPFIIYQSFTINVNSIGMSSFTIIIIIFPHFHHFPSKAIL